MIATVLPEQRVPVSELPEAAELAEPDLEVLRRLGIAEVRDAGERSAAALAAAAATALRRGADGPLGAFILVGGRFPEFLMVSEATRVQRAAGLDGSIALGVSELGCVSVSAAILVARGLLAADPALPGVVLAHASTPPGPRRFRRPVTVNGDGAMAMHLSRDGALRIVDIAVETNGDYWDLFQLDYVGRPYGEWREVCTDVRKYSFTLGVESRKRLARMNQEILARQGLALEDVDHFVMQNLSAGAFAFYEQEFGMSVAEACRRNLRAYGHLGSTDIALNLQVGVESGEFRIGERVLVMNNAPVAAWSSMLVEVAGPLPPNPYPAA